MPVGGYDEVLVDDDDDDDIIYKYIHIYIEGEAPRNPPPRVSGHRRTTPPHPVESTDRVRVRQVVRGG